MPVDERRRRKELPFRRLLGGEVELEAREGGEWEGREEEGGLGQSEAHIRH